MSVGPERARVLARALGRGRGEAWIDRQLQRYYVDPPPRWRVELARRLPHPRLLPSFVVLGPHGGGAQLLTDCLLQHPRVALPLYRDLGTRQTPTRGRLLGQLPPRRGAWLRGGGGGSSITGFCVPTLPDRSFAFWGPEIAPPESCKLIFVLRDPVIRAIVHWQQDAERIARFGRDPMWRRYPLFDEMVRMQIETHAHGGGGFPTLSGPRGVGYLGGGVYAPPIRHLARLYRPASMIFVDGDRLHRQPQAEVERVHSFLELAPHPIDLDLTSGFALPNAIEAEAREQLRRFYAPRNEQLFALIGQRFDWEGG